MNRQFLADRITATEALITAYEAAVQAFGDNGALQSYTLDTGQSRQVVTRAELSSLNNTLDKLYNRLAVFEARLSGGGLQGRPGW